MIKKSPIHIGGKALQELNKLLLKKKYSQHFILCDTNTLKHCLPLLISSCKKLGNANIIEIEPEENSKSIDTANEIWKTLFENKADTNSLIINLGGGMICDIGGFCASIYKRGIPYVNVPTSLLAMVDASYGGKTAINFNQIKNSIGSFYFPASVFIDPLFLLTLPNAEMKNGLTEICKMALVDDKKFWNTLQNSETKIDEYLIQKAVAIKTKIIHKDTFDKGQRRILNYGHTIGHALEAINSNKSKTISHGEAVVIGMILENYISFQKKLLSKNEMNSINQFLFSKFKPRMISEIKVEMLLPYLINDKKNTSSRIQFSLLEKVGKCLINQQATRSQIEKSLFYYQSLKND